MPRKRIESLFHDEAGIRGGAILPYLTAGFPDLEVTATLIRRFDALGARVIELGIPYSDSIADGPVIQSSFHAVIGHGFRVEHAFDVVREVHDDVSCGLVAMVSFSLVHRVGVESFLSQAAEAGFDGVIIPDLPVEESAAVLSVIEDHGLCHIGLVAPTTSAARRREIVQSSSGFVYQIARAGLTGEGASIDAHVADEVAELRAISGLPVCVGFGVSTAAHVRQVCSFADGAIVGSSIVRRIANGSQAGLCGADLVEQVVGFVAEIVEGTKGA